MARTFAERVAEWEEKIAVNRNRRNRRLLRPCETEPQAAGDAQLEDRRLALAGWLELADVSDDILGELKEQKEQADGYQASRDLLVAHFDFVKREGFEALQRVSWLEENARRLRSYVEEQATCGWCGCYEKCEEDCVGPATIEREAEMKKARQALNGFAL